MTTIVKIIKLSSMLDPEESVWQKKHEFVKRIFSNFSSLPSFEWFIAGRMLNAFFVIGIFETTFTFLLEFVGGNKWSTVG